MPYAGNPALSTSDEVRFLLGDTNNACLELTDIEVSYLIGLHGGGTGAAIYGAQALAAKYAGLVDSSAGAQRQSYSQRAKGYRELVATLRASAATLAQPISTGELVSADQIDAKNTALKRPNFTLGMTDNPRATDPDVVPEDRGGQP